MKHILLLISILLISKTNCYSQQELKWGTFYLGPFISYKAGLNLKDVYPGEKKIIRINSIPDMGVTCFYLFSKEPRNSGLLFELGLSNNSFKHTMPYDENKFISYQTSYITFMLNYCISGFSAGPSFGVSIYNKIDVSDSNIKVTQENRKFYIGFNLGYFITLLEKNDDKLNLFANAHLNITKLGWYNENDTTVGYESHYSAGILSFGIGFNYLFKLGE